MRALLSFRIAVVLTTLLLAFSSRAQSFDFFVAPSTNSVVQGNALAYVISFTNRLADLSAVYVTNRFSGEVQFLSSTNTFSGVFSTNGNTGLFTFFNVPLGLIIEMTLQVKPGATGYLTNAVTMAANVTSILPSTTNVVTTVYNPRADLAVRVMVPTTSLLVNDPLSYSILVTNAGPASAANVALTNTLPGVKVLSVSTTNQYTLVNDVMVANLGTVPAGSSRTVGLTVQPTNAGTIALSAAVGAASLDDPNLANNIDSASIQVAAFLPAQLSVSNLTTMALDHQTGLMKQTVRLSNVGTNGVPGARVVVSGLINWLFNAVGTNNGNPFVLYASPLAAGQTADLVLEYWIPSRVPIAVPDSSYSALAVPAVDRSVPGGGTNVFSISTSAWLPNGTFLIEFEAVPGGSYTVLYSSDSSFASDVFAAQPAIVAPANRVQWIDNGPPKTASPPLQTPTRYYRIQRN